MSVSCFSYGIKRKRKGKRSMKTFEESFLESQECGRRNVRKAFEKVLYNEREVSEEIDRTLSPPIPGIRAIPVINAMTVARDKTKTVMSRLVTFLTHALAVELCDRFIEDTAGRSQYYSEGVNPDWVREWLFEKKPEYFEGGFCPFDEDGNLKIAE